MVLFIAIETWPVAEVIPTVKECDVKDSACFFNFASPENPVRFVAEPSDSRDVKVFEKSEPCGIVMFFTIFAISFFNYL